MINFNSLIYLVGLLPWPFGFCHGSPRQPIPRSLGVLRTSSDENLPINIDREVDVFGVNSYYIYFLTFLILSSYIFLRRPDVRIHGVMCGTKKDRGKCQEKWWVRHHCKKTCGICDDCETNVC